jgi:hypothetical protein
MMQNVNGPLLSEIRDCCCEIIQNMLSFEYTFGSYLKRVISERIIVEYLITYMWTETFIKKHFVELKVLPKYQLLTTYLER